MLHNLIFLRHKKTIWLHININVFKIGSNLTPNEIESQKIIKIKKKKLKFFFIGVKLSEMRYKKKYKKVEEFCATIVG